MSAGLTSARVGGVRVGLMPGTLLAGRYRVAARIAAGGVGVVHRGWDERLSRPVALKVLHPHLAADADVERRFRAEARHAARVKHPNVVVLLDADDHDGVPFIVMELVAGTTLRAMLRERRRLTAGQVLHVLGPTCAGLTAIHETGLVHRDVKPENLLVDSTGRVRVTDFGIASALDATRHTPAGVLLGSVRYLAPELVLGHAATPASDQYALGIVVFEALTGVSPLPADDPAAVALRHAREAVPAPSTVDPAVGTALDEVVTTATALAPDDRYPSLDALLVAARAEVQRSVSRRPAEPRATTAPAPYQPPVRGPLSPRRARAAIPPTHARPVPARPPSTAVSPPRTRRHPRAVFPRTPPRSAARSAASVRARDARPPRPRRRGLSVLAIVALLLALLDGVAGMLVAPLCATVALRRIGRRGGVPRGAVFAYLALGIAALRILGWLGA